MQGHVARKGNRWYAVIYEGTDPVTGKEVRRWHPAGSCREDAERLAARLASELEGRNDEVRGMTFGAFLTSRWLPGQATRARGEHLRRLPAQHREPHHPGARPDKAATPARPPS